MHIHGFLIFLAIVVYWASCMGPRALKGVAIVFVGGCVLVVLAVGAALWWEAAHRFEPAPVRLVAPAPEPSVEELARHFAPPEPSVEELARHLRPVRPANGVTDQAGKDAEALRGTGTKRQARRVAPPMPRLDLEAIRREVNGSPDVPKASERTGKQIYEELNGPPATTAPSVEERRAAQSLALAQRESELAQAELARLRAQHASPAEQHAAQVRAAWAANVVIGLMEHAHFSHFGSTP